MGFYVSQISSNIYHGVDATVIKFKCDKFMTTTLCTLIFAALFISARYF